MSILVNNKYLPMTKIFNELISEDIRKILLNYEYDKKSKITTFLYFYIYKLLNGIFYSYQ